VRDIELVDFELQVKDLELIERKLHKVDKMSRVGDKGAKHGVEVLTIYKEHLEQLLPARTAQVREEDREWVRDMQLLSMKPVMFVCNVDDTSATTGNRHVERVREALAGTDAEVLVIAGALEAEIADLDDPADREVFLEDAGLAEPGVNKLIRAAYDILNLKTFFTVGPKEIRAWTIRTGMTAPQAAGVIHSDLERGFIRAEVMKYTDFVTLGSEQAVKKCRKVWRRGKKLCGAGWRHHAHPLQCVTGCNTGFVRGSAACGLRCSAAPVLQPASSAHTPSADYSGKTTSSPNCTTLLQNRASTQWLAQILYALLVFTVRDTHVAQIEPRLEIFLSLLAAFSNFSFASSLRP
jgi:hypothetical protein